MARLLWITLFVALVVAAAMLINISTSRYRVDPPKTDDFGLVALPDGATLIAKKGTVGRTAADWLDSGDRTARWFELGGRQFEGKSVEPTAELLGRVSRLTAMLKAYRDVDVHIVGYSDASGDPDANLKISVDRAKRLARLLEKGGIDPERLSVAGRGSADPVGDNAAADGRALNQGLALRLSRE
jgi:outer membrane protein OmpA-like peptidoglycan-associated protein